MKIFISWSGSHALAVGKALAEFVETTYASHVRTFFSDEDLAAGVRFVSAINSNLSDADLGIIVVTQSNRHAPWLLFEAGAIAAKSAQGNVVPLLLDLERNDLQDSPLAQFQNVLSVSRQDLDRLWERIWSEAGEVPSRPVFEMLKAQACPSLEEELRHALEASLHHDKEPLVERETSTTILDEILLGVNTLVRRDAISSSWTETVRDGGAAWNAEAQIDQAVSAVSTNDPRLSIVPGQHVRHTEFGLGEVKSVSGIGRKKVGTVAFVSGEKKLLLGVAPLAIE